MESSELALYRGLGVVRNYGIFVLVVLFALNAGALAMINWIETSDVKNELITLSSSLPSTNVTSDSEEPNLPSNIIALRSTEEARTGFYETRLEQVEYLAYANPEKNYTLLKDMSSLRHEVRDFSIALLAIYIGEVIVLLGWWFFVRTKIRELFETL